MLAINEQKNWLYRGRFLRNQVQWIDPLQDDETNNDLDNLLMDKVNSVFPILFGNIHGTIRHFD